MYETDTELFLKEALRKNKWFVQTPTYRPQLLLNKEADHSQDFREIAKTKNLAETLRHISAHYANFRCQGENLLLFGSDSKYPPIALARYWAAAKNNIKLVHTIEIPRNPKAANKDTAEQLENLIAGHSRDDRISEHIHIWEIVKEKNKPFRELQLDTLKDHEIRLRCNYGIDKTGFRNSSSIYHESIPSTPQEMVEQIMQDLQFIEKGGFKGVD